MILSVGNHGRHFDLKLRDLPGMALLGIAIGIVWFLSSIPSKP
jgi:hypothetical protein